MRCDRVVITVLVQCQEQFGRWTCYQDLRSCASQPITAFVWSSFGLQIPARLQACRRPCTQAKLHGTLVEEGWRVDFCQIHCTHLQTGHHKTLHRFPATSASFNVGLDFASNLLVRDQSCKVHGKMLFQIAWNSSGAAVLMSSPGAAVVVPLDLLLSYRRTSSSHVSSPAGRSCSVQRSGNRICRRSALRFPPLRGFQRRTNRLNASRPDGAAPRTMSKLSLSVKSESANMDLFGLVQNVGSLTRRTELLLECVVRGNIVLIFHRVNHWPES